MTHRAPPSTGAPPQDQVSTNAAAARPPARPDVPPDSRVEALSTLLDRAGGAVWRVASPGVAAESVPAGLPTGFPRLDAALPGGGWPANTLVEVLLGRAGIGEVSLWLPVLLQLAAAPRWVAWVSPPYVPYGPALAQAGLPPERLLWVTPGTPAEALWATEQSLRSGACAAALAWMDKVTDRALRRLKLAAEQGQALGVVFRPLAQAAQASPATLRLALHPRPAGGLDVEVLKCQGGRPALVRDALRHA